MAALDSRSSLAQTHESLSGKDGGMVQSRETPASAVKWFGLTIDCADDPAAEEALRRFYLEASTESSSEASPSGHAAFC